MSTKQKMEKVSERKSKGVREMQYLSILDKLCPEIIVVLEEDVF